MAAPAVSSPFNASPNLIGRCDNQRVSRRRVVAASVVAALLVTGVVWLSALRPDSPASVRALVYSTTPDLRGRTWWVWRANLDGTAAARIAEGRIPDLSPDGRWIAFVRDTRLPRTAYLDLYVMPAAGGEPERIWHYEAPRRLYGFEWSPGSDRLLLYEPDRFALVDRDGSDYRVVFREESGRPLPSSTTFAPSGDVIAYELSYDDHTEIDLRSLANQESRRLTNDGSAPLWGPDAIAFSRGGARGDIWLMRPDGTRQRRLTRTTSGLYPAAWSEDGRRLLAFNPPIHNGRLWAVDVRTGRSRRLTDWVGDLFPQGISRDGSTVLAAIGCGGTLSLSGTLETIPFEGGPPRTIVRGPCRGDWNA